jgi:phosphomannomutase/phosphoglucomutase
VSQLLTRQDRTVSQIVATLPQYVSTPTMHTDCADDAKYGVVEKVRDAVARRNDSPQIIDVNGVRAEWDDGWFLVRASSNLPALVIVVEATTEARLRELYDTVRSILGDIPEADRTWENDPFA